MPNPVYSRADILFAALIFSSQSGLKRRPVMVIYDGGDADLLIAPITGQAGRTILDAPLTQWQNAGLRLPSVVRVEKLATSEKSVVIRQLGRVSASDWPGVEAALRQLWRQILPGD